MMDLGYLWYRLVYRHWVACFGRLLLFSFGPFHGVFFFRDGWLVCCLA
jgi:hypothetical protein